METVLNELSPLKRPERDVVLWLKIRQISTLRRVAVDPLNIIDEQFGAEINSSTISGLCAAVNKLWR